MFKPKYLLDDYNKNAKKEKKKKSTCKTQPLQRKILKPVVLPVGSDGDLGCERQRERHWGTTMPGSGTKRDWIGESKAMFPRNCYKVFLASIPPPSPYCLLQLYRNMKLSF